MFPLLGVTWLFGLFLPLHKAFAYIFTIFNSTQVSLWVKLSIISCLYEYINAHTTYKPKPDPLISIILYFREKNLGNKEHSISQSIWKNHPLVYNTFYKKTIRDDKLTASNISYDPLSLLIKIDKLRPDLEIIFCFRVSWFSPFTACETARWDGYEPEDTHEEHFIDFVINQDLSAQ